MATITTAYDVNNTVYTVDANEGVKKGVVQSIDVTIKPTGTMIEYSIQHIPSTDGSSKMEELSVFNDIDLALAAYKTLVE
jgi:hypothetical protein